LYHCVLHPIRMLFSSSCVCYLHPSYVLVYIPFRVLVYVFSCAGVHPISALCATFTFLPHFDILDRQTAFVSHPPARFPLLSGYFMCQHTF
jgi:hypothetical protein